MKIRNFLLQNKLHIGIQNKTLSNSDILLLIEQGCNINQKDIFMCTPLDYYIELYLVPKHKMVGEFKFFKEDEFIEKLISLGARTGKCTFIKKLIYKLKNIF